MSKLAEKQVAFAEQVGKESHRFAFESAPPPRDPFATAPFAMERDADKPAHNKTVTLKDLKESGGGGGSQLSAVSGGGKGSAISAARSSQSKRSGSRLSSNRGGGSAAAGGSAVAIGDEENFSMISGLTNLSLRTPSSIRSSEPSAIARNKIAELQLRVELERVLRLQTEAELAAAKMEAMSAKASSLAGDR